MSRITRLARIRRFIYEAEATEHMEDDLTDRVETLERAITGEEYDLSALSMDADALDRLGHLEDSVDELEEQVGELEAATQALRGYVGNIRAVNEDVENRAETALSKVERLEQELAQGKRDSTTGPSRNTTQTPNPSESETATGPPVQPSGSERHEPSDHPSETVEKTVPREQTRGDGETIADRGENTSANRPNHERGNKPSGDLSRNGNKQTKSGERGRGRNSSTTPSTPRGPSPGDPTTEAHHCDACGQRTSDHGERQPTETTYSSQESSRTPGTSAFETEGNHSVHETPGGQESLENESGLEGIRDDDPLVSDDRGEEGSTLDRFRNLL